MPQALRRSPGLLALDLDLPARLESLTRLREAVEGFDAGLPDPQGHDLLLLATELFTNAVRHSGAEPSDTIAVGLERRPGSLRIEVRDPGSGFTPVARTPGARQVSGRGMFLLDQLADRWGVAHDGGGFLVWGELWTADTRTRHRRLPPRMLSVGADGGAEAPAAPVAEIPPAEEIRAMDDGALKDLINELAGEEQSVSARRRRLHGQIDTLRHELARRLQAGREDNLLQAADLETLARLLDRRMPALPGAPGP